MEQESAQNSNALLNFEPANEANLIAKKDTLVKIKNNAEENNALADLGFQTFEKCPQGNKKTEVVGSSPLW